MDTKSKIILISGPTSSGKSNFAIKLAKKVKGEIINADSMQVYKQLQILTARPKKNDQKKIVKYQKNILKKINDEKTFNGVQAERNVLRVLEGDCETAVGAISMIKNKNITLEAELFSLDGKERFYCKSSKEIKYAAELGIEVGENLKKQSKGSYKK